MALDVRLSRDVDEPWGFKLVGGVEDEMPLSVQQIELDSPAKRGGLLNGDTVLTINREEAIDMTLETACRRLEECGNSLTVGVMRGLYDPVLDDQEPIYDYEPEDLDPQLQPTEVPFEIQRFVEPADLGSNLLDIPSPFTNGLSESRSLTASPFVTSTKPYRPFSTEPVEEVPPLEDPIILNPKYRDEFGKSPKDIDPDYLINAYCKELNGFAGGFKLPISKQYDPDGTGFKQSVEIVDKLLKYEKHVKSLSKDLSVVDVTKETRVCDVIDTSLDVKTKESLTKDVKVTESFKEDIKKEEVKICEEISSKDVRYKESIQKTEKKEMLRQDVEEQSIKEELKYMEKMRQEIDLENIEKTALTIVEDSIERAVSVAEEIKKEIDVELSLSEEISEVDKRESKSMKSDIVQESSDIKLSETRVCEESNLKDIQRKVEKREQRYESVAAKDFKEVKEEISERVAMEDVKVAVDRKPLISEEHEEFVDKTSRKESVEQGTSENRFEHVCDFTKVSKTVTSGVKSDKEAENRAYKIGLQTIPNIRGVVHSSYHYDLLLRTFFLHLTDVMVALSRFLLSQPIFSQLESMTKTCDCGARSGVQKTFQETFAAKKVEKQRAEETKMKIETKQEIIKPVPVKAVSQKVAKDIKMEAVQEKKVEKKEIIQPALKEVKQEQVKIVEKIEAKQEQKIEKAEVKAVEVIEKKAVSGSNMAQLSEKKLSKDLTQKMDAVISEFQTVAVEDVTKETMQRNRRSRSRSQIEEEVMKEGDPLEWLSKVDSKRTSQETEVSKKEFSSIETTEKLSKVESRQETIQETRHKKSKTPKQTYVAIVEAHVFTNKDAIFEEQAAEFSDTSSVQSAEEINTAFEALEAISTENVALETAIKELETAKIVEESHELSTVSAQSTAAVKIVEEVAHESKEIIQEEYKKETAIQSSDVQEILIQETKQVIEPVLEIKEIKREEKVAIDINESLSIAESTEISIHESKSEFTNVEMKKESVAIVEQERAIEKVAETKPKVIEPKPVQIEEVTETVRVKTDKKDVKPIIDEYAALKVIKKVEMEGNLSPEIIEVQDISELAAKKLIIKDSVSNQVGIDISKVSEKSLISSQIVAAKSEASSLVDISKSSEKSLISSDISSARSEAKSMVDLSQMSQVSSTKSSTKEMEISKSRISEEIIQESSFTAKSVDKQLTLRTDLDRETSMQSPPSTISTPTPSTVPPTPLTDEYVFKLSLPLPQSRSTTPVPRDCTLSPEDEDPHIVKKKLIPHIDTTIERVVYDTPLPTPPAEKSQSPVYTKPGLNGGGRIRFPVYRKPGLFGGADKPEYSKEEIREIERKSSLLASAIDETIKSIEEYKEEVGIDTKKEVKFEEFKEEKINNSYHESYSKKVITESTQNGFEEIDTKIEEIMDHCEALAGINNIDDPVPSIEEVPDDVEGKIEQENIQIEVNTHITKHDEEKRVKFASVIKEFNEKVTAVEEDSIENKSSEMSNISEETKESTPEFPEVQVEVTASLVKPTENIKIEQQNNEIVSNAEMAATVRVEDKTEKSDVLLGFRPVVFDPEAIQKRGSLPSYMIQEPTIQEPPRSPYMTPSGELIGTTQGIVDGLEDPVMDAEVAKELGKPGISEEKIAEMMSGESEMLREAHVMGLSRVLTSHMHRADDSSVDFQKIKPMIDSLKDSEVLKALNDEIARQKAEEKKKEEKKWTTFLQKPKRPVPRVKFGYHGWTHEDEEVAEPYKVKIVKQAKPKVAPDYKPEDFNTGPLPWEERALNEPVSPVEPEEPILIPELPEFLEAVDPLKESEVPDLEDTGIPLPPPKEPTPPPTEEEVPEPEPEQEVAEVPEIVEEVEEKTETREDMDNRLAEQLVRSVQGMVDPNASVDQQLSQMRAQLAALAQLPEVIQQTLELVSKQLNKMSKHETHVEMSESHTESHYQQMEVIQNHSEMQTIQEGNENTEATQNEAQNEAAQNEVGKVTIEEIEDKVETGNVMQVEEEMRKADEKRREQACRELITPVPTEEDLRSEKQKKEAQLAFEARQVKQHPTPRVGKPKRVFGPLDPEERPVVLPGGRRWRKTEDVYNEQMFAETLQAQAELIQGKALGINFMKYEKPPVSLDHLKHSEVYKLVHDMDQTPLKRVEMRTPVIAEADYRERCRSMTPAPKHLQIPQQFHP